MKERTKRSSDELLELKRKLLIFLTENSGRYSINEIAKIFGLMNRRLYDFFKEFEKYGFEIKTLKEKVCVQKLADYPIDFSKLIEYRDVKKTLLITELLKHKNGVKRSRIAGILQEKLGKSESISKAELSYIIQDLVKNGYLTVENGDIYKPCTNFLENLSQEEKERLFVLFSIAKVSHPKSKTASELLEKAKKVLKGSYKENFVNSLGAKKLSFLDEPFVREIEDAILNRKKLKVKYVTNAGKTLELEIAPLGLVYSEDKDRWYLINRAPFGLSALKVDSIINIETLSEDSETDVFPKTDLRRAMELHYKNL